jgi:rSAM/selenodomain-associated transferase 1
VRAEVVVVFARAPERGRVKTRLAAEVGEDHALALYAWLARRVVTGLADPRRSWDLRVAATPDVAAVARWMPEADAVVPQRPGDLGARMRGALEDALAEGYARVVLVGTDCAAVDAERARAAFAALREAPATLGPALDGGYYLLGATRPLPVFDAMPWSTAVVAAHTRARLAAAAIPLRELPPAADVDLREDLASLASLQDLPASLRALIPGGR